MQQRLPMLEMLLDPCPAAWNEHFLLTSGWNVGFWWWPSGLHDFPLFTILTHAANADGNNMVLMTGDWEHVPWFMAGTFVDGACLGWMGVQGFRPGQGSRPRNIWRLSLSSCQIAGYWSGCRHRVLGKRGEIKIPLISTIQSSSVLSTRSCLFREDMDAWHNRCCPWVWRLF